MFSSAFGAMDSVISKLTGLLTFEYKLPNKVKEDIISMKSELESMRAFLKKMSEVEDELDEQVKCWRMEVRELSYDIEDYINKFVVRLKDEPRCELHGITSFIDQVGKVIASIRNRHQIAKEIQGIRACVGEASRRHKRYKVDDTLCKPTKVTFDPCLPALYKDASDLVGIDGPKDELIRWLTEGVSGPEQQLKVVPIVGSGGLGKTTANQVYHNLEGIFQSKAFVTVSQKPDIMKILREMLSGIGYNGLEVAWDEGKLIHEVRKHLRFVRYFVVLDDIWSISAWEILRCALPENNRGSRIVITTRIIDIAKACCAPHHCDIYHLKPLDNATSRRLFFKRIGGSEDSLPSHVKGVAEKILKKCGGMPLAIISVASLLATKEQTKEQWENVKISLESGLDKHTGFEGMNWILSLSYRHLPQHLKTCMLYLCMFPEDYIISKDMLVQQWIAEGFVCPEHGRSLEEVGYNYFSELINRSMTQPVDIEYNGEVMSCRVHDMIRSLIISKSNQENFVNIFTTSKVASVMTSGKIRRLSVQYIDEECVMMPMLPTLSHARSFSIFGHCNKMPSLTEFKVLRVLEMDDCWKLENYHLRDIGRLSQLKYLGLRRTPISELPEQIGELKYLETLDLRLSHLTELPATIVRLQRLVHLFFDSNIKLPDGIGEMQSLQQLSSFDVCRSSIASLQELGSLSNLRVLVMAWRSFGMIGNVRSYNDNLISSLGRLGTCSLQSVYIQGYNSSLQDFSLDSWCPTPSLLQKFVASKCLSVIPNWVGSLINLSYVHVDVLRAVKRDLDILGELPNLLFLRLGSGTAPQENLIIHSQCFRCLKEFRFMCLLSEGLEFQARAMPRLERLCFQFVAWEIASATGCFDFGIQHLLSLKEAVLKIDCFAAWAGEGDAAEAAIRNSARALPNNPSLNIERFSASDGDMEEDLGFVVLGRRMQQRMAPQAET
uniref:NB-ARC domain-containing protein n=1 Tax=Oryza brachyantha TaxID=4533 RepID=J3LDW0_ORYBR